MLSSTGLVVKKAAFAAAAVAVAISSMVAAPMAYADSESCTSPADGDCEQAYQAIAYSSSTGSIGSAWDEYRNYANSTAKSQCAKNGATDCKLVAQAEYDCVALAFNDDTGIGHGGVGSQPQDADNDAIAQSGGGRVIDTVCEWGQVGDIG
jgi:hypothetical protein